VALVAERGGRKCFGLGRILRIHKLLSERPVGMTRDFPANLLPRPDIVDGESGENFKITYRECIPKRLADWTRRRDRTSSASRGTGDNTNLPNDDAEGGTYGAEHDSNVRFPHDDAEGGNCCAEHARNVKLPDNDAEGKN
jgi:hypothetical protein